MVVWKHDNDLSIVVPDHPPEVPDCAGQRVLGNDEFTALTVTLKQSQHKVRAGLYSAVKTCSQWGIIVFCYHDIRGIHVVRGLSWCSG